MTKEKALNAVEKAIDLAYDKGKKLPTKTIMSISIADINDAPMFTHTKQFREHFNYIKDEFVRILSCL